MRTAMIAITTSSSTNVKAETRRPRESNEPFPSGCTSCEQGTVTAARRPNDRDHVIGKHPHPPAARIARAHSGRAGRETPEVERSGW